MITENDPISWVNLQFQTMESTHMYAKAWAEHGMKGNGWAYSEKQESLRIWIQSTCQTHGAGQRGRSFFSPPGGMYVTMMTFWPHPFVESSLALALGLSLIQSIIEIYPELQESLVLKWPNDVVFWQKGIHGKKEKMRKLAGVLLESVPISETSCWLLASFGLNVNTCKEELESLCSTAIALKHITGKETDFQQIRQKIQTFFLRYQNLHKIKEKNSEFLDLLNGFMLYRHQNVRIFGGGESMEGFWKGWRDLETIQCLHPIGGAFSLHCSKITAIEMETEKKH